MYIHQVYLVITHLSISWQYICTIFIPYHILMNNSLIYNSGKRTPAIKIAGKIMLWIITCIVGLLIVSILLIRLPAVQNSIKNKVIGSLATKLNTKVELKNLYINFLGGIVIDDLYLADKQKDTLLYAHEIKVGFNPFALIRKNVVVNSFYLEKAVFNYSITDKYGKSNLDFILATFSDSTNNKPVKSNNSWNIFVNSIKLKKVQCQYNNLIDSLKMQIYIGQSDILLPETNVLNKKFVVKSLNLRNSKGILTSYNTIAHFSQVKNAKSQDTTKTPSSLSTITTVFKKVYIQNFIFIQLEKATGNGGTYHIGELTVVPDTIDLSKKVLAIKLIDIKHGAILVANSRKIDNQNSNERNTSVDSGLGWNIRIGKCNVLLDTLLVENKLTSPNPKADNKTISVFLSNISLVTNNTFYNSTAWQAKIALLDIEDHLTGQKIKISLNTSFKNGIVYAKSIFARTGTSFIKADGFLYLNQLGKNDIPDFHFKILSSSINKKDYYKYFTNNNLFSKYNIPTHLDLKCNIDSKNRLIKGNATLNTDAGNLTVNSQIMLSKPISASVYSITVVSDNLDIGKILRNNNIGPVSAEIQVDGNGSDLYTMETSSQLVINSLTAKNKIYHNFQANVNIKKGDVFINALSGNELAKFNIAASGHIDQFHKNIYLYTKFQNVDLGALGLTTDAIAISGLLSATYKGTDFKHFSFLTDTFHLHVNFPNKEINLKSNISFVQHGDSIKAAIDSNPFKLTYDGDFVIADFSNISKTYLDNFNNSKSQNLTKLKSKYFNVDFSLKDLSSFEPFLPADLRIFEEGNIHVSFKNEKLLTDGSFKYLEYKNYEFENINFKLAGMDSSVTVNLSINNVNTPVQVIRKIDFSGIYNYGVIKSRFKFADEKGDPWFDLGFNGDLKSSNRILSLDTTMLLNYQAWKVPENNKINLTDKGPVFNNVNIHNNDCGFIFSNNGEHPEQLGLEFKNIDLTPLSSVFKGDSTQFKGLLSGNVSVSNIFNKQQLPVFDVDLGIKELSIIGQSVGELQIKTNNASNHDIANIELHVGNDKMLFMLNGDYGLKTGSPMHFVLKTHDFSLGNISPFTNTFISNPVGLINSEIEVSGSVNKPVFNGFLGFKDVNLYVNSVQTEFHLNDQSINFESNKINFSSFTIGDASDNNLVINGSVIFNDFKNIQYDLQMNMDNFLAYNVNSANQPDTKSKAIVSGDLSITGHNTFPIVKADVQLNEGSSLYYKMVKHNNDVSGRGIVEFVGAAPLKQMPVSAGIMENLNLTANITLDDGIPITIITDPARNLGLSLTAGGVLSMKQMPGQSPQLNGRVDITGGSYTLALSGIKRTFAISDSSSISWDGNIADPDLNLKASYKVMTPASGLMSEPIADDKYLTAIPFFVNVIIQGQLSQPAFHFQISMPSEYESTYGDVIAKLQIINSDESEVNRRAIFLLLFGSFGEANFTNIINNGSGGYNALISKSLNQFAAQMITFAELRFDLQSIDNYGGTTGDNLRTELKVNASKKFMKKKLTTQLGGTIVLQGTEEEQNKSFLDKIVPEFNVEYILDRQRYWKIKTFRKSEYKGVIEGKVISLGSGVVFEKNYEKPKDLFKRKSKLKKVNTQALNIKK